jgi:hypothetical protein
MSKYKKSNSETILDLWRPPQGAGDPLGCLATTYTFDPGLFDEQCLARFLEIESEPNREDLAFLLERESRLGSVYAGVMVDHTRAGVEHSLRWDILPVRIRAAKQHSKVSLLAWSHHIRIIVASANLTEPGYRTNYEVAAAVDLAEKEANIDILSEAVAFLRNLIMFVPGAVQLPPEVQRAESFLNQVERRTREWEPTRKRSSVRQHFACTLPAFDKAGADRSSLDEAIRACRGRGGSPHEVWMASPFFDEDSGNKRVAAELCKLMARGGHRELWFCVPAIKDGNSGAVSRLAAPKTLLLTPKSYDAEVSIEMLPEMDEDKNRRPWHAKMLSLFGNPYSALMIGSSNFTCAGMGIGSHRNAEANLLTIVDKVEYGRDSGLLQSLWPEMEQVADPECAEWLGSLPDQEEEEQDSIPPLPTGFLSASYYAGDIRQIMLRFDPADLPDEWDIRACGQEDRDLLSASTWNEHGRPPVIKVEWDPTQPPEKLLVLWDNHKAFLPLNVDDSSKLPPPAQLEHMSADDMLWILAATDPSAAFRAWAKRQQTSNLFDPDIDSATPIDLDPLRRYDLSATFLHRIRRRAHILAQLRSNLQRPVWSRQALEWRLKGMIGIEPLADRLVRELCSMAADEALLTLADFIILLNEVEYQPSEGSLSKPEFEKIFRAFLNELAVKLCKEIEAHRDRLSKDLMQFWERVTEQCRA